MSPKRHFPLPSGFKLMKLRDLHPDLPIIQSQISSRGARDRRIY
ncbi:unnamed protein product [Rhodiola kirilowii]